VSAPDAVIARNLSFSYAPDTKALRDVTVRVACGEKLALAGPNGSGKTTLFFCLCGLLKAASGDMLINGTPVRYNAFNPAVSYLFQSPDDQLFSPTVRDDVAFGPLNLGLCAREIDHRVNHALGTVQAAHLSTKPPHNLSGGEKRLVAIATLIAMQPSVYLFDEPTSNLDARNRRRLIALIQSIPDAMIISSHDLEFLLEVCGRAVLMDHGAVAADGEIREIFGDPVLLERHGLEMPHSLLRTWHSHF
jgi:cobalt/nickel transport system ATP-binding protein